MDKINKDIKFWKRVKFFLYKLLSIKVMIMGLAFYLVAAEKVSGWEGVVLFLFTALIVIFGREALPFLQALKGAK